jgi:hypothetical protein
MQTTDNNKALKLVFFIVLLTGIVTGGCDEKQEADYQVNATIIPDDDEAKDKKQATE